MMRSLLLGAALALSMLGIGHAGKPGGNTGPGGVIYFLHQTQYKAMNPDGSGKSVIPVAYWGLPFEPSHALHADGRWFLFYAGNRSLGAMKEDGTSVPLVVPGDDGDWQVWPDESYRWVFDFQAAVAGADGTDGLVSWYAVRRDGNGEVIDAAVCVAPVLFNPATGDVAGLDLNSITRFRNTTSDFDWSPDGTEIVFSLQNRLWILDIPTGSLDPLPVENAVDPEWSPDGGAIAFTDHNPLIDYIKTVQLDGLAVTTLASARRHNVYEGEYAFRPKWSPTGTHLLFNKENTKGYKDEIHIWRVQADGKNSVNLTGDLTSTWPGLWTLGWR